jgi:hypothetical protein
MSTRIPFQWNTSDFNWDATNPTDGKTYPPNEIVTGTNFWNDCALIIELINVMQGGGSHTDYFDQKPEKKKQFIKLLCKVQGKEYTKNIEIHKTKIFISDIKLVAKEVLGIDVKLNK